MMNGKCGRFEVKDGWFMKPDEAEMRRDTSLTPEENAFLDQIMGGELYKKARFKEIKEPYYNWDLPRDLDNLFYYKCPRFCGRGFIVSNKRTGPEYLTEESIKASNGGHKWTYQVGLLWVGGSKPRRRKTDE